MTTLRGDIAVFKRAFWITIGVILCLAAGFALGYLFRPSLVAREKDWPLLNQAYDILKNHGWKELPSDASLEYGMIRGMIDVYNDPYTLFIEPPQHELEGNALHGSFGGIGVRLGQDSRGFWVLYPQPGSPASRAGILEGDRLLNIDQLKITPDVPKETIEAALSGPVGQNVLVTIGHSPDFSPIELKIQRAEIPMPSVTWHQDPDESRLGIIEVNLIADTTPREIQKAVKDLQSRGSIAFALDLRDNTGGLLKAGVDTARLFLKNGMVMQQQYRGKEAEIYSVDEPGPLSDVPLVVFVNGYTASAAEIIAGSLKVHSRAKMIGSPTYGKDTIQLIFDLKDGSSLHVTSAHWWIPGLEPALAGNGLQPDILVEEASNPGTFEKAAAQLFFGTK